MPVPPETPSNAADLISISSDLERVAKETGTAGAAARQREYLGWGTPDGDGGSDDLPELDPCPHRPRCTNGYIGCDNDP